MTERGLPTVDDAPACPFVAFADDRDARALSPDHRHRCYAEEHPAPRAIAHQEAYCLSSSFPVCPTFQDWARREAATARAVEPPPPADEPLLDDLQPRRNRPRDWTAPPPWAGEPHDRPIDDAPSSAAFLEGPAPPGQGLAGSPADRLAGGDVAGAGTPFPATSPPPTPPRPDVLQRDPASRWWDDGGGDDPSREPPGDHEPADDTPHAERPPRVERSAGLGLPIGDRRPRVGQARPRRPPTDDSGPSWERPRRYEAYPSLRTRVGLPSISLSPLALASIALVIAAAALFFLPAFLGVGTPDDNTGARPTGSAAPSPSTSVAPTPPPAPTPRTYIVAPGDTLSRIASEFGLSVDQLLAANPQITNPNRIAVGDEIVIPDADASLPTELEDASPSPS
jgi:hypothetical protein